MKKLFFVMFLFVAGNASAFDVDSPQNISLSADKTYSKVGDKESGDFKNQDVLVITQNKAAINVAKQYAADNIADISKFLKWNAIAVHKGDVVNREIGKAPAFDKRMGEKQNGYYFVSKNSQTHLLVITSRSKGFSGFSEDNDYIIVDAAGAEAILERLNAFKDGNLSKAIVVDEYN